MSSILNRLSPTLRVHSWGGFGSQLFTVFVIMKLQARFPGRRLKIIVHTSGITRMITEFNFKSIGIDSQQIEDFKVPRGKDNKESYLPKLLLCVSGKVKKFTSLILNQMHIVGRVSGDESLDSIKPWTIGIRGHYTNLSFEKHLVNSLYKIIFDPCANANKVSNNKNLVIHYRLGDLLHLTEKTHIHPERVEKLFEELRLGSTSQLLFSDSTPEEVKGVLKAFKGLSDCKHFNSNPVSTLDACISAATFIGTNAKLSLWAALFRYFIFNKESYLPRELSWAANLGLKSNWY